MEYADLYAYHLPPGIVTTWTPASMAVGDGPGWHPGRRSVGPDHERPRGRDDAGGWSGGVMRLPAPFVADTLIRALRAWFARHEALRVDAVLDDDGWRRHVIEPDAVAVKHDVLGAHTGAAADRMIAEYFAALSPAVWPHCVFATITEPGADDFTLVFGADHRAMDASSELLWFDEIAALYERAADGESDASLAGLGGAHLPDPASLVPAARGDDRPGTLDIARWRAFVAGDGFPRCPGIDPPAGPGLGIPGQRLDPARSSLGSRLVDARTADAFGQLCTAGGGSLQAGLLAAIGQVLREQQSAERLRLVVPMHTRVALEHATAIGWYVGFCPVDLDLAAHPTLAELLVHAQARLVANRDLVEQPLTRVMEELGLSEGPKLTVSFIDGRFVPGAAQWDGWQQARVLRGPAYGDDEVHLWFVRTRDGLDLSARYPATGAGERMMRGLVAGVSRLLEDVAATVGVHAAVGGGVSA